MLLWTASLWAIQTALCLSRLCIERYHQVTWCTLAGSCICQTVVFSKIKNVKQIARVSSSGAVQNPEKESRIPMQVMTARVVSLHGCVSDMNVRKLEWSTQGHGIKPQQSSVEWQKTGKPPTLQLWQIHVEREPDHERPKALIGHRGQETELIDYVINHTTWQRWSMWSISFQNDSACNFLTEEWKRFNLNQIHFQREGKTLDHVTSSWEGRNAG